MSFTGGYYTEKLLNQTGLRVVVLNTNLYYDQNKLTENIKDPADQFSWADKVLQDAAKNNEKVSSNLQRGSETFSFVSLLHIKSLFSVLPRFTLLATSRQGFLRRSEIKPGSEKSLISAT